MAIKLKSSGKAPLIETGAYVGRVVQIIDLGIQPQEYEGNKTNSTQELYITFELPTERIEVGGEDKPRWLSNKYKVSMSDKSNFTALLNVLDPNRKKIEEGGVEALLNTPCMVNVGVTGTKKNNKITSISPVPKGLEVAELYNDPISFSVDEPDADVWMKLPDWLKDTIRGAEDFLTSPLCDLDEALTSGE